MSIRYPTDYDGRPAEGHCGVLATAIAAGVSFEQAWDALKRIGHRNANWKGGSNVVQRREALKAFGRRFAEQTLVPKNLIDGLHPDYVARQGYGPRCTVATFAAKRAKAGVTYMLRVNGHVVTLRDGMVADQSGIAPARQHRSARTIVQHVTEMLA